jgi:hypothetical protein
MARQTGIIKIKGTVGDLTFYKSQDGDMVRQKGGIEKDRIANDPAFVRTRENGKEFGASGSAGKLVLTALRPLLMSASDSRVYSRLLRLMMFIKELDTVSARGDRNVGVGISAPGALPLIKGFDFNIRSSLGAILFKPYSVNIGTGAITIPGLIPVNDIVSPQGATHITLKGGWARVDFVTGVTELQLSNVVNLPIDATPNNVALVPVGIPAGPGTNMFVLQIEFYQEVNGLQYSLKNGAFNALSVVEAS